MGFQLSDHLLQLFLSGGIIRQRLGLKRGQQRIPDGIHLALEVAGVGSDGDHRVFIGNHDAELTPGAITAVLDRLERGHWIRRVHDTVDRRRVMISGGQAEHTKMAPIFARLRRSTREVLGRYSEEQLDLIADFLRRTTAIAAQHRQRLRRS